MRSIAEITDRAEALRGSPELDCLGVKTFNIVPYLPFSYAKKFLKENVTADDWKPDPLTRVAVVGNIKSYMPFAWEKANNCRGISAQRSLMHMDSWLWLLGGEDSDFGEALSVGQYSFYGKPQLVAICDRFQIHWQGLDDGKWRNDERDEGITADAALEPMSERNIPVRIMLTAEEWKVFDLIAQRHRWSLSAAIEEMLLQGVAQAIEEAEKEADGD